MVNQVKAFSTCEVCKVEFQYLVVVFAGKALFSHSKCEKCREAARKQDDAKRIKEDYDKIVSKWIAICPSGLNDTELSKLPRKSLLYAVMKWEFGPRGLLLAGETRTGKTRCAWQLLKREHFAGRKVIGITSFDVAAYPSRLMTSALESKRWIDSVVRADVALLDDVFKSSMTERAEELLFLIADERTSRGRPIILTMNESAEAIQARLTPDRGLPIIGRIRDFCSLISV